MSIIVPVHNEERHIAECIESILSQSYSPVEVLVVDDGSTDRTPKIASDWERRCQSVRVISQPHRGKAEAVNRGAREAAGEILFFVDGDMVLDPAYVEKMVAPILAGESVGTCHAAEYVANPNNRWSMCLQARSGLPRDRRIHLNGVQLSEGSTIFRAIRRKDYLRVGGFDSTGYLDDQTLYPKVQQRAVFVRDAVCGHYNLETVGEVFAAGKWASRSMAHNRRVSVMMLRHMPPLAVLRAIRAGAEHRSLWMIMFEVVVEAGIFVGFLETVLRKGTNYGR